MRLKSLLAAVAVLWLAAPAAAQPDPEALAEALLERMAANQGSADNYTLVLRHGDMRVPVYVYRGGGEMTGDGATMQVLLDFGDYTATDGVVVPRKMRVRMRIEVEVSPEERQEFQEGLDQALAELEAEQSPEAREVRTLMEVYARLLLEGEMDLPMTVEEVRVNSGPPEWLEDATIDEPGA